MFAAQFDSQGKTIDYTPVADVAAGAVIVQGELVAVAMVDIPANTKGALAAEGVFKFLKDITTAFAVGVLVYWDVADQEATEDADGGVNKLIGKTVLAAADTDAVLHAKLDQ